MKKWLLLFCTLFLSYYIDAQTTKVVFNGNALSSSLKGKEVVFNQKLYVCGRGKNRLYLSYERLKSPDETAKWSTSAYTSAEKKLKNGQLSAYCPDILTDTIRLGAIVANLKAVVTDDREITVNGALALENNARPKVRPDVGKARLIVCSANVQNYFPKWSGTPGASSNEEFTRQHNKLMKALRNIDADIFCLLELQDGQDAVKKIVHTLNSYTAQGRYAYVDDGDVTTDEYTKAAYIYRTDKVTPVLALGHPYNSSSVYYKREFVQAFDEISSGERFVLSLNHYKAKVGGSDETTNSVRMANVTKMIDFLLTKMNSNYYQDEDFLILGDLNCATMEEPILYMATNGFENQTARFSPNEYSYVYNRGTQYIDHAFATPSMAAQITGVAPYHINADESNVYNYKEGKDESMYRYSDHDPIIVGLNLGNDAFVSVAETSATPRTLVYSRFGQIVVEADERVDVEVFDMLGRTLFAQKSVSSVAFPLKQGLYIVRAGADVKKVLVR